MGREEGGPSQAGKAPFCIGNDRHVARNHMEFKTQNILVRVVTNKQKSKQAKKISTRVSLAT